MRVLRSAWAGVLFGCLWLCGGRVVHAESSLPVSLARPKQLRVDGDVGEWRGARFMQIGDDDAGRVEVALAYDTRGLFVAARVHDDVFVRTRTPTAAEDALVLSLAVPQHGRFETSELWLFAGEIGESPASAQLAAAGSKRLQPLDRSVEIVEGPLAAGTGYVLEAFVPWKVLPHGDAWAYARGAVRLQDVDRAGQSARVVPPDATGRATARLPWLMFDGGPVAAMQEFVAQKNLDSVVPALDWVGDVCGDPGVERVLVVGTYVLRSGQGASFTYADLPVSRASDVRSAELRDLSGDGRPELVLRLHAQHESGESDLWSVLDLHGDAIRPRFAVETRKQTSRGLIEASLRVDRGTPALITLRSGVARGVSADDYTQTSLHGVVPIPVPWGPWLERVYAWDGQGYAVRRERSNPAVHGAVAGDRTAAMSMSDDAQLATGANATAAADSGPASDAALLQAYRAARGLPAAVVGRFAQRANLAADVRPETLAVFGRDCVVVGQGFRGGNDFIYFGLPAREDADVLQVTTGDLTGDGRHEVLARVRQRLGPVVREVIHVFRVGESSFVPLLAVEVRRTEGVHSITNQVSTATRGKHATLRVAPGVAKGWSASDYPYSSGTGDGVSPLLLPWIDKTTEYYYDGTRFVSRISKD